MATLTEIKFQIPRFLLPAFYNPYKFTTIPAGRRCFQAGTLVLTSNGYVPIEQVQIHDRVLSYNTHRERYEYEEVIQTHNIAGGYFAKPMIQLQLDNIKFSCTFDHEIYARIKDGEKARWIPAFVIAWRAMDADNRHRLQILCEQYGQDINKELQVYWGGKDNAASSRWLWVLSYDDKEIGREVSHNQATQGNRKSVDTKSDKQAVHQSYQRNTHGQQGKEFRVVHKKGKRRTLCSNGQADEKLWRKMRHVDINEGTGVGNKGACKNISESQSCFCGTGKGISHQGEQYGMRYLWENVEASVVECCTTYDLTVRNNHNYFVTTDNLLVHNTGKTFNAVNWKCEELLSIPGLAGLWVDTKQANIDKYVDRYFKKILKPIWDQCHWDKQRKILTFPNKSYLDFASAEKPENMEGFEYDRAVLNEAGIILKKSSLWDNTLMPMFKGKNTKVKIIGTPKGKNKFFQLSRMDDPDYKNFKFSAYDSPFWEKEALDKLQSKVPQEVWRQEYLAEFIEGAGSVFRSISQCVIEQINEKCDLMAVDLAKHQDYTVILGGNSKTKRVTRMERFNQIDWKFQKKRIYGMWKALGKPKVIIDSTGVGDAIYDDLVGAGMTVIPFKFTSNSKNEIIQNLSVAMDNQDIHFVGWDVLINELEIFGYDVTPSGNIRYNAPDGFHDDTVVTLAMLNKLMQSNEDSVFVWTDDVEEDDDWS